MRKLLPTLALAIAALAMLSNASMAARIEANPSGARRATARSFTVQDMFGIYRPICELVLDFELSRESEGTLNVLGSILVGRINRATVRGCRNGTIRAELLTAGLIYIKEVTNRTRVEVWILNFRFLAETPERTVSCLYDMLGRGTMRENPGGAIEAIFERALEVRTLPGSNICPGTVVASGLFTLDQAVTFTLTP
jgi:hypothetical protein